jgi:hypothetical protein
VQDPRAAQRLGQLPQLVDGLGAKQVGVSL